MVQQGSRLVPWAVPRVTHERRGRAWTVNPGAEGARCLYPEECFPTGWPQRGLRRVWRPSRIRGCIGSELATTTPTWCGCDVHQSLQKPHERPTSNADQGPGQEQAVLRRGFSVQKRPREPVFGRGKTQGSEVHLPLQAAR